MPLGSALIETRPVRSMDGPDANLRLPAGTARYSRGGRRRGPVLLLSPVGLRHRRGSDLRWRNALFVSADPESVQFLDPDIPDRDFGGSAFELDADLAGLVVGGGRIVVDQDRHQLAVEDMDHGAAARDDLVLVPIVDLHVTAERAAIADRADELWAGASRGVHHLAAPCHDAKRRVLGVELAASRKHAEG